MDLAAFKLEDLILSALKSEIDAKLIYISIAGKLKNAITREKLKFIAEEEQRHKDFFENLFIKTFPDTELVVPESTPVPLPEISINDENIQLSEIFSQAMEAELAAHEFYNSMAERFEGDEEIKNTLKYFANMEMGHYRLFEIEKENAQTFDDYNEEWPMMHVGP